MPITVNCACGKTLHVPDEHAGKRVKCTACGAILAAKQQAEEFDDFEVVEESSAPASAPKPAVPAKARLKAVVAEEEAPAAPPPTDSLAKPKKKKKKKRKADAVEGSEDWYENLRAREARVKRVFRGSAFIALGAIIVIGVAVMWFGFREDVTWLQESGGRATIGLILLTVIGLAAIGKGVVGLAFGQFLGEDD